MWRTLLRGWRRRHGWLLVLRPVRAVPPTHAARAVGIPTGWSCRRNCGRRADGSSHLFALGEVPDERADYTEQHDDEHPCRLVGLRGAVLRIRNLRDFDDLHHPEDQREGPQREEGQEEEACEDHVVSHPRRSIAQVSTISASML